MSQSVQKRANITVTAKTDQAAQEFDRMGRSIDGTNEKLNKFIEKARAANTADRFAAFDKATQASAAASEKWAASAGKGSQVALAFGSAIKQLETGQASLRQSTMMVASAFGPLGLAIGVAGSFLVGYAEDQMKAADAAAKHTAEIKKQARELAAEKARARFAAEEDKYSKEQWRQYRAAREAEVEPMRRELKEIENSLAQFGRGKDMEAYIRQEAELKMDIARGLNDYAEVASLERAEEIRQYEALGKSLEGTKSKTKALTEEQKLFNAELAKARAAKFGGKLGTDSPLERGFDEGLQQAKDAQVAKDFASFRKTQAIDAVNDQRRGDATLLEAKLQGLELEKAAGVDAWSIAQREADAKLSMLQANDAYIQATLTGKEHQIAMEENAAAKQQVLHEREMQRIARDLRERERARARIALIGNSVSRVHEGLAAAAIRGAVMSGQSVRQSVKQFAAGQALEMGITGTTEAIRGAVAMASYNYPKAAQHFTNSGLAFAESAALGAVYGVASIGGGGRGKSAGGIGGDAFGFGPAGGGGGASSSNSERRELGNGPPISRVAPIPPPPRGNQPRRDVAPVINIYSLTGPDSGQIMELRRVLKRSERDDGDVN